MRKRLLCLLLSLLLLCGSVSAAELGLSAPSALLMEKTTGTVLYEQNAHELLAPASVTKVMTLLLVMEALEDGRIGWDDTVTASAAAAEKGGSQIYLEENEQLPLREMLKAVVVSSANDCACALAEHVAGSEAAFVSMMNTRAAELGMTNTHFVNCTGLDDQPEAQSHRTTAYDIALMSRELLRHEAIREYTTIWMDTVRNGTFGLSNTNKLVRFYDGTTGLKTGYTSSAGYCLSASAEREGMELIAVVLHCDTSPHRFESAKAMLNYGFSSFALVQPKAEEDIPAVPVVLGEADEILPELQETQPLLIDKAKASSVRCTVSVDESVTAPVEAGQQLGTLCVTAGDETLAELPLVAPARVEALRWWDVLLRMLRVMTMG